MKFLFKSEVGSRWVLLDWIIGFSALLASLYSTPCVDIEETSIRIVVSTIYGLLLVICLRICGLNARHMEHMLTNYEITLASIQGCLLAFTFFAILINLVYMHIFGRYIIITTLGLSILSTICLRVLIKWYTQKNPLRIAFVGCNNLSTELEKRIACDKHFEIVCRASDRNCDVHEYTQSSPTYIIKDTSSFTEYLRANKVNTIVCFYRDKLSEKIKGVLQEIPFTGIDMLNKGAFIELFFREVPLSYSNLYWHTDAFFSPTKGAVSLIKRILDLLIGSIALLILSPIFILVVLLIKLDSKGPIILKQQRVGFLGQPFTLYKFRSMHQDAEKSGAQWATQNDPRTTRFGAILRKTRMDEIPQLFNVLKGDMALVGPRPERPEFTQHLEKSIPLYRWRYLTPPGLTGWAQIRYGYTDSIEDTKRKLQFDLFYIKNFSLRLDLEILLRTIPLLMKGSR